MQRNPYATAALLPGAFIAPRPGLDLDGSLRYARPATGFSIAPYPPAIGYIQGLLPFQDGAVIAGLYAKGPTGPWSDPGQVRAAGAIFVAQDTRVLSPELPKVNG